MNRSKLFSQILGTHCQLHLLSESYETHNWYQLTNQPNNELHRADSLQTSSSSASYKIPNILWNVEFHYRDDGKEESQTDATLTVYW